MRASKSLGFTIVEVLIISPIIILIIGGFIGLAIATTGDALKLREKNALSFGIQNALSSIEDDASKALSFPLTTNAPGTKYDFASPQGRNNDTTAFTVSAGSTLLIKEAATTTSPLAANRQLVYIAPSASCSSNVESNPYRSYMAVYFVDGSGTLWRRTILESILPTTSVGCGGTWQKASCNPTVAASNQPPCYAEDEKILDNVTGFTINYFDTPDGSVKTTPYSWDDGSSPSSIRVTLTATRTNAGQQISQSSSLQVTSANIKR